MEEKRRAPRIKEENEVTITVDSEENNLSQAKIRDIFINNYTKDISESGAGIKTNIRLPVDALIELEFTSKGVRQQIKTLGKVKWVKVIIQDESYEAGVEFCGAPSDAIKKLGDYISWKLKDRLNNKRLSPINSGDINTVETKEQSPIKSSDINTVETKELSPIKNKQWIKIAIISLCTIILIVVLLKIFGYIPEFDRLLFPNTNKKVTKNFAHDSITTKSATLPAPPIAAPVPAPVPEATPVPVPASAPEATQKTKVIGNSDSKRYHLPGMKYYNAVKAYHRVEFDSEADAIKAGYNKAPQ
jgi:PilZ domain.